MDPQSSVEKALDILFHLHASPGPVGVTSVGRALGLPKSSAHRLLAALCRRGLVERDEHGQYQPGMALIALGLGVLERDPVVAAARPILEQEAAALGETFFLVGARSRELLVLDKVEGSGFLRASPQIGARVPLHATAVGKLYLAFAPELVERESLSSYTPETITDAGVLEAEVDAVRTRGWAANRDEWVRGLGVLAAPVRHGERLMAAVAVAAASPRLTEIGEEALATRLLAAARLIESRLGAAPEAPPMRAARHAAGG